MENTSSFWPAVLNGYGNSHIRIAATTMKIESQTKIGNFSYNWVRFW